MALHGRSRRRAALLSLLAAGGLTLAACGNSGGDASSSGAASADAVAQAQKFVKDSGAEVTWPKAAPIAHPADVTGKSIAIIPLSDKIPLMHGVALGMQDALSELGATAHICDGGANPSTMADCLKSSADQGDIAAVALYMDYAPLANAIDAVTARGLKVLVGGVSASGAKPANDSLAYADNTAFLNAEYANVGKQALNAGGAETHLLVGRLMDSSMTKGFSDAAIDGFKELCPDCEVNSVEFTTSSLDKLPTAISAALAAHPKTNVLFVPPDAFVPPALQGVQAAGFADKVKVVGTGADPSGLARVAAGTEISTSGMSVEFEGWRMANALMQLLSGEEVTPVTEQANRVFTQDVVASLGEIKPQDYFTSAWFGGDAFKADYLAAWGKKG